MSAPTPAVRARGAIRAAGGLMRPVEVARFLEIATSNVHAVSGLIQAYPGIPVYLRCEVEEAKQRLDVARAKRAQTTT